MKKLAHILAAATLAVGCAPEQEVDTVAPLAPEGFDLPVSPGGDGLKPAFETETEKRQSKAEQFDVRGQFQDIFGFTSAPSGAVRAIAEFENTDAVLLSWAGDLSPFFADVVEGIVDAAPVYIITPSVGYSNSVRDYLARRGIPTDDVKFFEFENDAFWTRDYGPVPVALADGRPAFIDHRYYPNRRRDDAVPTLMGRFFDVPTFRPQLSTEGGNFMANGEGLCVATEWVVEQNPGLGTSGVLDIKRDYYGCDDTVILERMEGEGTGHVDMFAKFTTRDTVMVGSYDRRQDPVNAAILDRNAERLANTRLADGSFLRVIRIPMPASDYPVYRSYTNSLIVNDTVIVPTYRRDRTYEGQALAAYQQAFPANYKIVTVDSEDVIQLAGAVHCVTMGFNLADVEPGVDQPRPDTPEPQDPEPEDPAQPLSFSSEPQAAIQDGVRTEDVIEAPVTGTLGRVFVDVDIKHTYVGDLRVTLTYQGDEVELMRFEGGSADDVSRTFAVDAFSGLPAGADWTLAVEDYYRGDEGVLSSWTVRFE
ncbi:MAG: agmatine deiminase family protein [Bradymonadia bacterium]